MSTKQKDDKHVVYSVKVSPDQAAVLDKICETIGVNSYQMFQKCNYGERTERFATCQTARH